MTSVCKEMKYSPDVLLTCELKEEKFLGPGRYSRSVSDHMGQAEGIRRNGPSVSEKEQMRLRLSKNVRGEIQPVPCIAKFKLSRKSQKEIFSDGLHRV